MGRHTTTYRAWYAAVLGAYCLYAAIYIARTSFVIDGTRYFTLLDDAMISMRYAENLIRGYGPVFNAGVAPVEGYTNPLWMLYMALVHLLPVGAAKISLVIQISGLFLGLATLVAVKRLAEALRPHHPLVPLAAVALTAFYLPLNTYNLQGMEVGLLAFGVTLAMWLAARALQGGGALWPLFALLGGLTLVRIDAAIPAAVLTAGVFWALPARRGEVVRWSALCVGGLLAAQTALRYWYYGDLLPNTYYLKMTGYPARLRIAHGWEVLVGFLNRQYWLPFAAPLLAVRWLRHRAYLLLLAVILAQAAYSVYVGGDVWDWWGGANRFISIAMPLLFVALSLALATVAARLRPERKGNGGSLSRPARRLFVAAAAVCLVLLNMLRGPASLSEWALTSRPLHWTDNANMVRRANLVRELTSENATIAVTWAGAIPYFSGRPTVDLLGKTDRRLAHGSAAERPPFRRWGEFLPGHMKWDYAYSIGVLQPDVIVQLWGSATAAAPWLRDQYDVVPLGPFVFSFRREAPTVHWQRLAELSGRTFSDGRGSIPPSPSDL
ncbi:MAG TPA: hypothetical protein PKM94_05980 [candidate division Zixibacteria bacterium]|nr:hypothetical protein [candidate division Zixibacteria bacterium]